MVLFCVVLYLCMVCVHCIHRHNIKAVPFAEMRCDVFSANLLEVVPSQNRASKKPPNRVCVFMLEHNLFTLTDYTHFDVCSCFGNISQYARISKHSIFAQHSKAPTMYQQKLTIPLFCGSVGTTFAVRVRLRKCLDKKC